MKNNTRDITANGARQVVVITGASAGVGRATAIAFAREGASIGLIARGQAGLDGARREVEAVGGRAVVVVADVADPGAVERAAATIEQELGPIDVWVNNAMVSVFAPVKEITPEEFRRVTEVTYLGVVYGTMAALERMRARNRGVIIQVGSALAFRAIPLQSAYCGAKHAIKGFTESLRSELLHDRSNVRIAMVQMPALNTPQFTWSTSRLPKHPQPVPPIFQPEVAARAIVWASRHDRPQLVVGAPTSLAILGEKIAPGLLDRFLAKTNYDAQQIDLPFDLDRPANLWEPVDAEIDRGTHGPFDDRSSGRSPHFWLTTNRGRLAAAALGSLAAIAPFVRRMR